MLYIDSSSLLKTLWQEPESSATCDALSQEHEIVISSLAELEIEVQLRARWLSGDMSQSRHLSIRQRFQGYRDIDPFTFATVSGSVLQTAIRQNLESGKIHCRTLDRLHLAAMEELGIRRLMTHDTRQAIAAKAMGFQVITPA